MKKERTALKAVLAIVLGAAFFYAFVIFLASDEKVLLAPAAKISQSIKDNTGSVDNPGAGFGDCTSYNIISVEVVGTPISDLPGQNHECYTSRCANEACRVACISDALDNGFGECTQQIASILSNNNCVAPCRKFPTETPRCTYVQNSEQITGRAIVPNPTGDDPENPWGGPFSCSCGGNLRVRVEPNVAYGCSIDVD